MKEDILAYGSLVIFMACMFGVAWFGIKEIMENAPDEEE
jgi:lipoprotein